MDGTPDEGGGAAGIEEPAGAVVRHIYISPGHDYWGKRGEDRMRHGIREVGEVECVAGMGLVGDRYFDYRPDFKGQVTFLSLDVVGEIRERSGLPELPGSVFRRNLVVSGLGLSRLRGVRFRLGGITFEGCQECKPCHWMDRVVAPGTMEFMKPEFRGGLRAKILTSGILRVGPG